MALLIAGHSIIVEQTFGIPHGALVGKCLEAVRIGSQRNAIGNQPIKRLATSFGVRKIGEARQQRKLTLPSAQISQASTDRNQNDAAELVFGLYLGSTASMTSLTRLYASYLDASTRR
jgi:hypothetical protein